MVSGVSPNSGFSMSGFRMTEDTLKKKKENAVSETMTLIPGGVGISWYSENGISRRTVLAEKRLLPAIVYVFMCVLPSQEQDRLVFSEDK